MEKRIQIAYISPDILNEYHKKYLFVLEKYQQKHNVSITVISPFMLSIAHKNTKEVSLNLFKLAARMNFDGYILSSNTMLDIFNDDCCKKTIAILSKKITISLSYLTDQCCSVVINNKTGMDDLVSHFIDFHQYKEIGFIKGPKWHNEANERFKSFTDGMKKAGLPINDKWIFESNFQSAKSRHIIDDYLEAGNKLPEAIIAVNDNSTIGVLNALKENKSNQDIATAGFDNLSPAEYLGLTTVEQPINEQIDIAVKAITDQLKGKPVKPLITLDSSLVIRSSCGCTSEKGLQNRKDRHHLRDDQIGGYNLDHLSQFSRQNSNIQDLNNLKESIRELLQNLRIESCCIYLFKDGTPFLYDDNQVDKEEYLFLQYSNQDRYFEPQKNINTIDHLEKVVFENDSSIQVISNLQFQNEYYGHITIDLGEKDPLIIVTIKQELELVLHNLYTQRTLNTTLSNLKDSAKENQGLLSLLAHDINNLLSHISLSLEILKNETGNKENLSQFFTISEESINDCSHIIDDVLSLQRFKLGTVHYSKQKIDLKKIYENLNREFEQPAKLKKIQIKCFESWKERFFYSNNEMLKSILRNLISNAIKFSSKNKEILLSFAIKEDRLIFKVIDQGPGFSDIDKTKIFTPFESLSARPTGSESSTGLGLSLVKTLVDQLGGEIDLKTKEGSGSCFTVTIPESAINSKDKV